MSRTMRAMIGAVTVVGWCCGSAELMAQGGTPSPAPDRVPVVKVSPPSNKKMSELNVDRWFVKNLPKGFEPPQDDAGLLLLKEYGAVFLASNGATPPKKVVFRDEADVLSFQSSLKRSSETIGGYKIELQSAAMKALKAAIREARSFDLSITPRGADSARRGYDQTVSLWASRVDPALVYWVGKGRLKRAEADRIRAMTPYEQVPEILKLEQRGIYFAKDLSKSIIYSVAPPGASQHLSMLALDIKQFGDLRVRSILARHGWFQTVVSDLPHFTFLGMPEAELPGRGLKLVLFGGHRYWVPNIDGPEDERAVGK
ncbi:MAG TPA: hypothetical protein VNA17_07115 [Pyrinomonadaceae bacterium]|nr:hypothetical protein [Pyrinomonadaceae bacterium]